MSNLQKIWILIALPVALLLAGCTDDVFVSDPTDMDEDTAGDIYIRIQMNLNGSGVPGFTRADATAGTPDGTTTPGTDRENEINSIDLFIYDEKNELSDYKHVGKERLTDILTTGVVVPVFAQRGEKIHAYIAANLTEKMRQLFLLGQTGNALSLTSELTEYRDVIDEFVPGTAGHQATLQGSQTPGIPMTGQLKTDNEGSYEITIPQTPPTKENPMELKADVSRIVAKIHLLAQTSEHTLASGDKIRYVQARDKGMEEGEPKLRESTEYTDWIGWIRLSDVRYIPNGMNKSSYIFPQANKNPGAYPLEDLNMDMSLYRRDFKFDELSYMRDFTFYTGEALHSVNISDTKNMGSAEPYDETRMTNTFSGLSEQNRYTQGMYCTENYFDTPQQGSEFHEFLNSYDDVIPVITHLTIAARLTPRYIVVIKDYAEAFDSFITKYKDNPDRIRNDYGLKSADFTKDDIERWTTVLKERYFPTGDDSNVYSEDFRIIKTWNEADAADLIKWSLIANNLWSGDDSEFTNGKYPARTFFVYDRQTFDNNTSGLSADDTYKQRYLYLTAGAVANATDQNIRIKTFSVPHVGGWGYYYTYLDQTGETINGATPYSASQVTRNTYYLVNVTNFGMPGGTITHPRHIRVNTTPIGWDYSGKGDINLH